MSDYVVKGTCGSCSYYEYAGQYQKGYCSYYRAYYFSDDSCNHWEDNGTFSSGSSGCFLTSACCKYKGLSDDCEELQVLRNFRDSYLREKAYGPELIKCYYEDAPEIVAAIDKSDKREEIYEEIYSKVLQIKEFIEEKKYEEAVVEYMFMLYKLKDTR